MMHFTQHYQITLLDTKERKSNTGKLLLSGILSEKFNKKRINTLIKSYTDSGGNLRP